MKFYLFFFFWSRASRVCLINAQDARFHNQSGIV
ncbi:unnamed protein product [Brassica napus]|uniref:(rape) hypothetical protein n=1 Tax=Brassica napus TaxID=3708 RepID=A0A816K5Q0_BRANA|nr:unnamed protein product [Brassica napus]